MDCLSFCLLSSSRTLSGLVKKNCSDLEHKADSNMPGQDNAMKGSVLLLSAASKTVE